MAQTEFGCKFQVRLRNESSCGMKHPYATEIDRLEPEGKPEKFTIDKQMIDVPFIDQVRLFINVL